VGFLLDKYCRQLYKKGYQIDRLLEDKDLGDLKALLKRKFDYHRDLIDSFFNSLNIVK
jgi:hypothetical protein